MQMKWRCTVCGYVHDGDEPPDLCPVCGVATEKFVPVEAAKVSLVQDMIETFQPHAVAAHFPNALVPTLLLFVAIAFLSGKYTFDTAAFYLLVVVLFTVPATLATGIREWQTRFNGKKAVIFKKKIAFGSVLFVLAAAAVALRYHQPGILQAGGALQYLYFALLVAMLGCVMLLGHYGGKLVFSLMGKD